AHDLQLLFELLDPLLRRQVCWIAHDFAPAGSNRSPLAPILPAMLTQPYQNRRPALDAVPRLGLLIGQLALFNLVDHSQFKSQGVITLGSLNTLIHRDLQILERKV